MLWTGGDYSRLPLRHYEGLPAGDFVHPREEEHPLQVRAAGWPEANPDVGQHAGLLSFRYGAAVHHVPVHVSAGHLADFAGAAGAW